MAQLQKQIKDLKGSSSVRTGCVNCFKFLGFLGFPGFLASRGLGFIGCGASESIAFRRGFRDLVFRGFRVQGFGRV